MTGFPPWLATLVDADLLVILTDIDGLYTSDPSTNPDATLIPLVEQVNSEIESRGWQTPESRGPGGHAYQNRGGSPW